jgi:hypothetical protein
MRPRAGLTLVEVLAAIFLMGIGLLALLTLFPLGALNMARAVRDDRAANAGANAAALARALDVGNDPAVRAALATTPAGFAPPDPGGAGYPVYVDPFYAALGAGPLGAYPGLTPGLMRSGCGYAPDPYRRAQFFTFLDEMNFQQSGRPAGEGTAASLERPGTFSWAYLVRRRVSAPLAGAAAGTEAPLVELTVVVYASRNLQTASGETTIYPATGAAGQSEISLPVGTGVSLKKGDWVLDTSYTVSAAGFGSVNAYFYQVDDVEYDAQANQTRVTVQGSLRAPVTTLVVTSNVVGVFEKGVGWRP